MEHFKITVGQAKVANALSFSLHVGADADMTNKIEVDIESMDSASLGIKGLNVKDKTGNAATYAIDAIADAVAKVSSTEICSWCCSEQLRAHNR